MATQEQIALFRSHLGDKSDANNEALGIIWDEADALIKGWTGKAHAGRVPPSILQRATLEVAAELHTRRNAPGGVLQGFSDLDGGAIRLARDPLTAAYPLLRPFIPLGLA